MPASAILRKYLLAILGLGIIGVEAELLLMGHYDGYQQLIPVVLLGVGAAVMAWWLADGKARSLKTLRAVMVLYLVAGVVGVILHYDGNAAFEVELSPEIGGVDLIVESLTGATPALAPGTMIQLGLLGLLYTFRHPVLSGSDNANHQHSE
jgi:hypothetical protein